MTNEVPEGVAHSALITGTQTPQYLLPLTLKARENVCKESVMVVQPLTIGGLEDLSLSHAISEEVRKLDVIAQSAALASEHNTAEMVTRVEILCNSLSSALKVCILPKS